MAARIEDYGLIGDLQTAALVSRHGCIDWLCFPRFDSGACFAALLGNEENGRWSLRPAGEITRARRRYRDDTLILETELSCDDGIVRLIDFMPPRGEAPDVVRIVEGVEGTVRRAHAPEHPVRLRLDRPVGSSARAGPARDRRARRALPRDTGRARRPEPPHRRRLRGRRRRPRAVRAHVVPVEHAAALADRRRGGARGHRGVLARVGDGLHATPAASASRSCARWSRSRRSRTRRRAGIVAAPTTSLPESLGGVRNWDYRYCWLRDATLTLLALVRAGYDDEARAWRDWLLRAIAGLPEELQIMYGIAGERRLTELELAWLDGYEGSRPVRIGNAASGQLQLDVYGEVARRPLPRAAARGSSASRGRMGAARGSCSSGSRTAGASPTRGSGRCAARAVTSRTRR